MASMAEPETLRLLLQNKFDRIENLVQMNHAATLAVPSVLAATWGISLQERGNGAIPILCIISISLLLVWRYFAHYLDDDITSTYCQIIKLEQILGVLPAVSLYQKIFFDIWIFQDWTRSRKDKKSSLSKKYDYSLEGLVMTN